VKASLAPGIATTKKIRVDESRVIAFMGDDCRVYATPRIISDVEYTCREFLLAHLDAGEDSVGTKVNWEHVGPALLGAEVTIAVKLLSVDGRRVTFEASVNDATDAVARGTHERFIVDVQKVRERLLKKARKA
jgi:fluoroacetyl-CoA thioesterase